MGAKGSWGLGSKEVDKKRKGEEKNLVAGCDYSGEEIHQEMLVTRAEEKEKNRNFLSWSEYL